MTMPPAAIAAHAPHDTSGRNGRAVSLPRLHYPAAMMHGWNRKLPEKSDQERSWGRFFHEAIKNAAF
ncbi:hypothetical protein CFR76_02405 [Komagataeibacter swingsii]|uniref:Uncharacterized protein n=1 Tax=Komagataeibacter swingsii TaxID=215220 RepID=A0A2V4RQC9_9PROT|nr:hypothetical protein CFR76_02405 [Komagataeibacter swingsii]